MSALQNVFLPAPAPPAPLRWQLVKPRFTALLEKMAITPQQAQDGLTKAGGVIACLNRHYRGYADKGLNGVIVGSWGKQTRVRPSADVDLLFVLPAAVFQRYAARGGNRQSDLLQEMKRVLAATYSRTEMRGDGQVVVVSFDSLKVEVVPAFLLPNGQYLTCDTHDEGSWRLCCPFSELGGLEGADGATNGAARDLARLGKLWRRAKSVPLAPFLLERLAIEFLRTWPHVHQDMWYDWMVRDFFAYLVGRANSWIVRPGTGEWVWLGDAWLPSAQAAVRHADLACFWEDGNWDLRATQTWQQVFGTMVQTVYT